MAKNDSKHERDSIFNEDTGARGMILKGLFAGSIISVMMILLFCVISGTTSGWNQGLIWCVSATAAGMSGGLLQQCWFSFGVLVKPSYPVRIAGFGATYFAVLALCAALGHWVPVGNAWAWISFGSLYLLVLAALTTAFTIVFRHQGASYTQRLEEYRKKRG